MYLKINLMNGSVGESDHFNVEINHNFKIVYNTFKKKNIC